MNLGTAVMNAAITDFMVVCAIIQRLRPSIACVVPVNDKNVCYCSRWVVLTAFCMLCDLLTSEFIGSSVPYCLDRDNTVLLLPAVPHQSSKYSSRDRK
jgi:hypothetical protein